MSLLRVAVLCRDIGTADPDHRQLVATDPAREHFFLSRGGVESPALPTLHERDRERPSLVADDERLAVGPLIEQAPPFGGGDREDLAIPARGRRVRRCDQLLSPRGRRWPAFRPAFPALTASISPRTASSGVANVRWVGPCAATMSECAVSAMHISATAIRKQTAPPRELCVRSTIVTGASRPRPRFSSASRRRCFGCSVLACWPRVPTSRSNSLRMRPSWYRFAPASPRAPGAGLNCCRGIHTSRSLWRGLTPSAPRCPAAPAIRGGSPGARSRCSCLRSLSLGALFLRVARAVAPLVGEILPVVLPILSRVLAVVVIVVPCVVVHVGPAVPSVGTVVVVVVDGRANRDARRETNQTRDRRIRAVVERPPSSARSGRRPSVGCIAARRRPAGSPAR